MYLWSKINYNLFLQIYLYYVINTLVQINNVKISGSIAFGCDNRQKLYWLEPNEIGLALCESHFKEDYKLFIRNTFLNVNKGFCIQLTNENTRIFEK